MSMSFASRNKVLVSRKYEEITSSILNSQDFIIPTIATTGKPHQVVLGERNLRLCPTLTLAHPPAHEEV